MIESPCSRPVSHGLILPMGKALIVAAGRVMRAEHAPRKKAVGFAYLKLAALIAMIVLPWVGIVYVVRILLSGH